MRWLLNRSTRDKLILGFGSILLCLALVTLLASRGIEALQDSQEHLAQTELANAEALSALRSQVNGMQATVVTMMSHPSRPGKEAWHQEARRYTGEAQRTMRTLQERAQLPEAASLKTEPAQADLAWKWRIRELAILLKDFRETQDTRVIPLIYSGNLEAARHYTLYIQTERYLKIAALTEKLADQAQAQAYSALEASSRQAQRTKLFFLGIGVFSMVASAGLVQLLTRSIAEPLSSISGAATRIAGGDLSVEVPHEERQDEIGALMRTFNQMALSLREITAVADQIAGGNLDVTIQPRSEQDVLGKAFAALDLQSEALRRRNSLMEADIKLAREIQQAFLPLQFHEFAPADADHKVNFHHHYDSSSELGGDFFDIWEVSDHEVGVFVCDVMGHGVRSALVTAVLRGLVEELRPIAGDPGRLLTEVNRDLVAILKRTKTPLFATAFYLVVDLKTSEWRFANAGHPSPFWLHHSQYRVEELPQDSHQIGAAMGVLGDEIYTTVQCPFELNDRLLLITDGLTEASNTCGEEFGEARLISTTQTCIDLPPAEFFDILLAQIRQFSGKQGFEDDVCLIDVSVQSNAEDQHQRTNGAVRHDASVKSTL